MANTGKLVLDGLETTVRTSESVAMIIYPTVVANLLDQMHIPSPAKWSNLSEVLHCLTNENSNLFIGTVLEVFHDI